jgi:hydrogenase maturation protein HypF
MATAAPLLAVGAWQKNCFSLVQGSQAFLSQHLGDLESHLGLTNWQQTRELYQQLFNIEPQYLVADQHPDYLTSRWAQRAAKAGTLPAPLLVQHHHAHIASVLAEHNLALPNQYVIGFAFDGSGLGPDGTIWGGEVLLASLERYERLSYLYPVALPGGAQAIREPWRMAYAWLKAADLRDHPGARTFLASLDREKLNLIDEIIEKQINTPLTSSMGRLFDAVSALLAICPVASYEGEAACLLEAAMSMRVDTAKQVPPPPGGKQAYHFEFDGQLIDPRAFLRLILDDLADGLPVWTIALGFHQAVLQMVVEVAEHWREQKGINQLALAGGVFINRWLASELPRALRRQGFEVYTNKLLPGNDGSIAYGQAAVAIAQKV